MTLVSTRTRSSCGNLTTNGQSSTPGPPSPTVSRTGTRPPAYRPATERSSAPTSTSPTADPPRPSSVRASSSRSSTSAERRSTSASSSAVSGSASPRRWATSSCVRMLASGLRSSCAASATKARWVRRAAATRSSISLRVVARALISSWVAGTGSRSVSDEVASIRAAPRRSASTGRNAAPMIRQAMTASTASSSGKSTSSSSRSVRPLASTSAVGAAATTVTRLPAGVGLQRSDLQAPRQPGPCARHHDSVPSERGLPFVRRDQGRQPVGGR